MKQWEYKIVRNPEYNGMEVLVGSDEQYLNDMGLKGWELVQIRHVCVDVELYYFKRQR